MILNLSSLLQLRLHVCAVIFLLGLTVLLPACNRGQQRTSIPPAAQTVLDTAIQDIDFGNYDKIYREAAEEWRNQVSLEDSRTRMQQLRDTTGRAHNRTLQTAREEQTSTAPVAGHSLTVIYQTNFERGPGMEAFVLIEHGGRWYLAKYYVTAGAQK